MPWSSGSKPCCARSISCNLRCKTFIAHSVMRRKSALIGSHRCSDNSPVAGRVTEGLRSAYKTSAARTMPMTYCKRGLAFMGAVFFELAGTAAAQSPDGWFLGCKAFAEGRAKQEPQLY